jgi:hypothetical protein
MPAPVQESEAAELMEMAPNDAESSLAVVCCRNAVRRSNLWHSF